MTLATSAWMISSGRRVDNPHTKDDLAIVAHYPRRPSQNQRHYSATCEECQAVVQGKHHWCPCFRGRHSSSFSDHAAFIELFAHNARRIDHVDAVGQLHSGRTTSPCIKHLANWTPYQTRCRDYSHSKPKKPVSIIHWRPIYRKVSAQQHAEAAMLTPPYQASAQKNGHRL